MEATAACHLHSDWSYDGRWTLKELSDEFRSRGVQVLLMTEHDRGFTASRFEEYRAACAAVSSDEILVVPGIEYSDSANRIHVLVWGTPFLGEGLPTGQMLEAASAANGIAVLAHPSRKSVWQDFDAAWATHLLGIEVWNRKYDGWAPSRTAPHLVESNDFVAFVGLDFHTAKQMFPLRMILELSEAKENAVLDALRSCRCSAHAFGVPFNHSLVRTSIPVLGIAEQGRKKIALFAKRTRNRAGVS